MARASQTKNPSKKVTYRQSTKIGKNPSESKTRKKKKGSKTLSEIRKYNKSVNLLLKRNSYRRVVMDRLKDHYFQLTGKEAKAGRDLRIQSAAIEAMQQSTEDLLQRIMVFSNNHINVMKKKRLYVKHVDYIANLLYPAIMVGTTEPRTTKNSTHGRNFEVVVRKKKSKSKASNVEEGNGQEKVIEEGNEQEKVIEEGNDQEKVTEQINEQ